VKDICILKDSHPGVSIENKKPIRFLREINEKMSYTYDKCEARYKLYLKYNHLKNTLKYLFKYLNDICIYFQKHFLVILNILIYMFSVIMN